MARDIILKDYQAFALLTFRRYLERAVEVGSRLAYMDLTRQTYDEPQGLEGLPYVCLRVPTGGGKTLMAAHAVGVAADAFLKTDTPCVVWLVPSNPIREQTIKALKDRAHPYRRALAERFGENVRVMSIAEALYSKRPDYDGGAVIIVATIQAFRVEETEGRKVYDPNGELMDHVSAVPNHIRDRLDMGPDGTPVPSLANALRMRRPMLIVDEAHNARTDLSFETLKRLDPSLILELTATPSLTRDIAKGRIPSNVLHHVSAAELKSADMVKLPIVLRANREWKLALQDARLWLDQLDAKAQAERRATGELIRPVMLIQAQKKGAGNITFDDVKTALIEDLNIPADQIAIATGSVWELDGVDLAAEDCPVRFIITVQALKEGWDCPNAYVLCSIAENRSSTAVEQILGRVLRLPSATRKQISELNQAYAFAATTSFMDTANALKDGLIANGFEKIEADALVRAPSTLPGFSDDASTFHHEVDLPEDVDTEALHAVLRNTLAGRVEVDLASRRLRALQPLEPRDVTTALLSIPASAVKALEALAAKARKPLPSSGPAVGFRVPYLCVQRGDQLEIFDRGHFLDIPWRLDGCDPTPILTRFTLPSGGADEARVDVDEKGKARIEFVRDVHAQLALSLEERGWSEPHLIRWLDKRLAPTNRRDITQASSQAFIRKCLGALQAQGGHSFEQLARLRFRLLDALSRVIEVHRRDRETSSFETGLFGGNLPFRTSSDIAAAFDAETYFPARFYQGAVRFEKHVCLDRIGDMNGEEVQCAVHIDNHPRVRSWVRNPERQSRAFWLQTSQDKFYPDFVASLEDGRTIAIEYKGADRADSPDTQEKELIGKKWAEASGGVCDFLLVPDKNFALIDGVLGR